MSHMSGGQYTRAIKSILTPVVVLLAGVALAALVISILIALGF